VGWILLVMRGVVLLLILMLGVLIYRMLRWFLVFWVLIFTNLDAGYRAEGVALQFSYRP
jgi:hypothetical protein